MIIVFFYEKLIDMLSKISKFILMHNYYLKSGESRLQVIILLFCFLILQVLQQNHDAPIANLIHFDYSIVEFYSFAYLNKVIPYFSEV